DREWQEVLTLADSYAEQDRRGRSTFSYRKRSDGNETAAVALYRRERRRRVLVDDEPSSQELDGIPPSHQVMSAAMRRVPYAATRAVYKEPGRWNPERLRTAMLSCPCTACQRAWPNADEWWRAHNLAMQRRWPRKIRPLTKHPRP